MSEDQVEEMEIEEVEADEAEAETEESEAEEQQEPEAEEEPVLSFGDEEEAEEEKAEAPEWVKELRKTNREIAKENKRLKVQIEAAGQTTENKPVDPGAKPTLSDYDFDEEAYEQAYEEWQTKRRKVAEFEQQKERQKREQEEAWQAQLNKYNEAKAKLVFKDVKEAEENTISLLSELQQGIIVEGAENPALVVYALGKNERKLKELSQITSPVKFAIAIGKLEKDLKIKTRKAPPEPEKMVSGTAPKSGTVDSQLERLRKAAEKSGDYSDVAKYKRQLRNKK